MGFFKKALFFLFALFILALFVWALYLPKQDISAFVSETIKEQKQQFDLFYRGVTLQEISNGVKYWEIKAVTSTINETAGTASLETTEGTFFEKGEPVLRFKAPLALWRMERKQIVLFNPVGYDAKTDKGTLQKILMPDKPNYFRIPSGRKGLSGEFYFRSQKLSWDMKSQMILCEEGLWLEKGDISGMARRLKADVGMKNVTISGSPRVYIANDIPAVIEAESFVIDSVEDVMEARNGVRMTSNEIMVNSSAAAYRQAEGMLILSGGVTAVHSDFSARGDSAEYKVKEQKMTITGNCSLRHGSSVLTGENIEVDMKSRRMAIKGRTRIVIPEEELKKEME